MDEESKRGQQARDRYKRSLRHMVGYDEQKRRKADSSRRRSERSDGPRRQRDWDEDDGGYESFEKIKRTQRAPVAAGPSRDPSGLPRAVVVGVHHGKVELDSGVTARIAGHLVVDPEFRLVVGDAVAVDETEGQARVEARLERRTTLARPDPGNPNRSLVIAANVDLAVIVVAAKNPELRPGLVDRLLLALADGGVEPVVCVNKVDLLSPSETQALDATLAPYRDLGCRLVCCSAATNDRIDELRAAVQGRTCVFVGHSGVGKSSLLNAIDPEGARVTGATRDHDGKGRHTTTWSSLRELGDGTRVIDTPGVRSFGLEGMDVTTIRAGFGDFARFAGRCRFADCSHVQEPDCAVRAAAAAGDLAQTRYDSYLRILETLE